MIDEIHFLYNDGVLNSKIRELFLENIEAIITYMKLSGFDYSIYMHCDNFYIEICDTDWQGLIVTFEMDNNKLRKILIQHNITHVNDGSEEDFLLSLEILKGAVSIVRTS